MVPLESGDLTASNQMGNGGSSSGENYGRNITPKHSSPAGVEGKNVWNYTSTLMNTSLKKYRAQTFALHVATDLSTFLSVANISVLNYGDNLFSDRY